jgi:hypothetical protein
MRLMPFKCPDNSRWARSSKDHYGPASAEFFFGAEMRKVKSISIGDDVVTEWRVPTRAEAMARSSETWGRQYDKVERRNIDGGLPIVIERLSS